MERKEAQLLSHLQTKIKPTEPPRSSTQKLYKIILRREAQRRQKNREASLARNKALSQPFTFYERDLQKARERALRNEDIDDTMFKQFRAKNIPWRILIPRFKMMMERDEHEREVRIRRNAEISYKNARLPPRMQAHADKMKKDDLDSTQPSQSSAGHQFSLQPVRARSVPDFRRLQKTFISKMEQLKKSKNPTKPIPFKFSLARPSAHLRTHMDQQNQAINPTLKRQRAHSARPPIAPPVEQPATTAKHDARVEMRRQQME